MALKLLNFILIKYVNLILITFCCYCQTEDGLLAYIAAQGPIGPDEAADGRRVNTIRDFWELVWQEQVNTVVMLTQTREGVKVGRGISF
jgi:protein tyrosine phosphatase